MAKARRLTIGGVRIGTGETHDLRLQISQLYTGEEVWLPLRVQRAKRAGPVVFVTAALHGNEINGTGVIRELIFREPLPLRRGTLICAPIVNIYGFERNDRYMPDRRDLNRCFPGSPDGSLASRYADAIFREIITKADYGIDLHTAAVHRTNYPNVRGDLKNPQVRELAEAFGCELIVRGEGPEGSMRRAACEAGVPTILFEAGEVSKIEQAVLDAGVHGVRNVLIHLGMLAGERFEPIFQTMVNRTTWVRAALGGLLRFYVGPGELVEAGQPIAGNEDIYGDARSTLLSPVDGVVLGMTTYPAVHPGEPVMHIAEPRKSLRTIRRALRRSSQSTMSHVMREHLATNIAVASEFPRVDSES